MQIVGMVGRAMKAVIYGHKHEFCVLTKIQGVSHRNTKKKENKFELLLYLKNIEVKQCLGRIT